MLLHLSDKLTIKLIGLQINGVIFKALPVAWIIEYYLDCMILVHLLTS